MKMPEMPPVEQPVLSDETRELLNESEQAVKNNPNTKEANRRLAPRPERSADDPRILRWQRSDEQWLSSRKYLDRNAFDIQKLTKSWLDAEDARGAVMVENFFSDNPEIAQTIQMGDISQALNLLQNKQSQPPGFDLNRLYHRFKFHDFFERLVADKVDDLVKSGDVELMKQFVLANELDNIGGVGLENIAVMPKEVIFCPELQLKLKKTIEEAKHIVYAEELALRYVSAGLMTQEDADAIISSFDVNKA